METLKEEQDEVSLQEVVLLAAKDSEFYSRFFFPKTVRQRSPEFHKEINEALFGLDRFVAVMVFRDGAKTTLVRLYISKLIAYAISRTIMVVGKSQDHAIYTLKWLKRQVEFNSVWAQTFQLKKGSKWADTEIEIINGADGTVITILALGITGSTRGVNIDDYRPDTIVIDDPSDEENTATKEQREKTDNFINGSLRNSLAPASEAPHAKLIFLQTLLHPEDSISRCEKDPAWKFLKFSVFDEKGQSRWPDRYPTEVVQQEKASFIARGKLRLWMREKECTIVSDATAVFDMGRVKYWDILPDRMTIALGIDPVPPPSERELAKGLEGKDFEVIAVVGKYRGKFYVLDYAYYNGHNPDFTVAKFFEFKVKYNPRLARVESVNYQRTLKWLLEQEMMKRRQWLMIDDGTRVTGKQDKRKKTYRIIDVVGSAIGEGKLYIAKKQTELIEQLSSYPDVAHDDIIDAVAMAIAALTHYDNEAIDGEYDVIEDEKDIPALGDYRHCP